VTDEGGTTAGIGSAGATRWPSLPIRDIVTVVLVMLVLGGLSVYRLGSLSLWRDEVSSVVFASAPLGELVTILGRDRAQVGLANMATYYTILHFWLAIGETEARIRFLSVIAGVVTIVPLYLVAHRIGGWRAAASASAFYAVSRIVVQWNQEARGYSMAMLVSATLTWLVIRAVDRQQVRWWLAYGLLGAIGLYVHFFVGLTIAAHALWVLWARGVPEIRGLAALLLPLTVAAVPIPITAMAEGTAVHWIDPVTLSSAWGTLWRIAGTPMLFGAVGVLMVVAAAVHRPDSGRHPLLLVLLALVIPIVAALLLSLVRPMFIPRYLVVIVPAMAIVVGVGLAALRPPALRAVVAVGLALLLALNLPSAYRDRHQEDWRAASRWIAAEVEAGDRILFDDSRRQLSYYLERFGAHIPEETSLEITIDDPERRVWVVMRRWSPREREELRMTLDAYELVSERAFGRVRLMLLEPAMRTSAHEGCPCTTCYDPRGRFG
jgi:mannosyltransferase